jgi:hypothetical protein
LKRHTTFIMKSSIAILTLLSTLAAAAPAPFVGNGRAVALPSTNGALRLRGALLAARGGSEAEVASAEEAALTPEDAAVDEALGKGKGKNDAAVVEDPQAKGKGKNDAAIEDPQAKGKGKNDAAAVEDPLALGKGKNATLVEDVQAKGKGKNATLVEDAQAKGKACVAKAKGKNNVAAEAQAKGKAKKNAADVQAKGKGKNDVAQAGKFAIHHPVYPR